MDFSKYYNQFFDLSVIYLPKVVMALLTLIIGWWVIQRLSGVARSLFAKGGLELSLAKFLSSIVSIGLKIMLLFSVANIFGYNTTSFVTIFSALMIGVGMALNGSLGHLVSGVMIMIFKPFKVGDLVDLNGHTGTVESINAFNTTLKTLDNKHIIVSNSNVTNNTITNITGQGTVGVELTFGIAYNASIDKARDIILRIGKSCPWILDDPEQKVVVASLGDSSVNLASRPFCKSADYWNVFFYMQENVKKAFDAEGIGIPFPQMDVHVSNN